MTLMMLCSQLMSYAFVATPLAAPATSAIRIFV
jgi:hypothetical protein